jgi:hypothetical protein
MPIPLNTATLAVSDDARPIYDPPPGVHGLNCMTMPTGAARAGLGEFVLARPDYDDLAARTSTGAATLALQGTPGPGVSLPVYIAGAVPLSVSNSPSDRSLDFVKVVLRDARFLNGAPLSKAYNVQKQGFPISSGSSPVAADFFASTLSGGSTIWTWANALSDAGLPALPTAITTWKPRNLIFDDLPPSRAQDLVAAMLYLVNGFDWATGQSSFQTPGVMTADNTTLYVQASVLYMGGGKTLRNPLRLPGSYKVHFQAYNADAPDDPFAQRRYQKSISTGTGQSGNTPPLHVGGYVAMYTGGAFKNTAELDVVAADLAFRALLVATLQPEQLMLPGIWPFKPDGAVRRVQWVSDAKGARTLIHINCDEEFNPLDGPGSTLIVPLGTANVGMDAGTGARYVSGGASGSSLARVVATSAGTYTGTLKCKAVTKDTTTGTGSEFDVQLLQGHAVGDVFFAIKSGNGTDNVGVDWVEHLMLTPSTVRYRLLQVEDATGRLGIDSARFE